METRWPRFGLSMGDGVGGMVDVDGEGTKGEVGADL